MLPSSRLVSFFALTAALGCAAETQGYLVGTSEVRQQFGVEQDTFPEVIGKDVLRRAGPVIQSTLLPFGLQIPAKCIRVFQGPSSLLGYAAAFCNAAPSIARVADGDALLLLTAQGDSVLKTILAPGGIEIFPEN